MKQPIVKLEHIRGAGGGKDAGGSARTPVEDPDSLRSIQYARILFLLGEGETGGLVDGLKSVTLNGTPVQNPDGTFNFKNVTMNERTGTQSQSYIPGFEGAEAEKSVGLEVTAAQSVTRTITNVNATAVRVTLGIPQLTLQNTTNGDLGGSAIGYAIDVQNNGGGFVAQPLRQGYSSGNFSLTSIGAVTTTDATKFKVTVGWVGQAFKSPQTCLFQLQYREVGDVTWLAFQNHTFSGSGTVNSSTNGSAIGGGGNSAIGGGTDLYANSYSAPSGSKTFDLTLPLASYQFRVVKVTGSINDELTGLKKGAAYGGSVSISGGQLYQPFFSDGITGKTTSRYQRSKRIELPAPGPWDIRVRRNTADSVTSVLQNKSFFDTYTEIVDAKLRYPNRHLVGIKLNAREFNSIPTIGFRCYGRLVQVPSNYDSLTREYDGAWDGNFQQAWTNNPAWAIYDISSHDRYGLGKFINEMQLDKWALYTIGQYCDEMVGDGFGGLEPRFTCNLYLQTREQAYTVIANMASICKAMSWWASDTVRFSNDAPADAKQTFVPANTVGGRFDYSGSSSRVRHTVALISWNDMQDAARQKIEYVEDAAGIARYGIIQTEVIAFGCTSRGQAHRMGKAILFSELYETETITFTAGMDSVECSPGDVFLTVDPIRSGARMGGRLKAATVSQLQLDAPLEIAPSNTYLITCKLPDGTLEERTITTGPGTTDTVDVTPDFSDVPQVMSIWVIAADDLVPESWRIVSMSEKNKAELQITGLSYRPEKYQVIEQGIVLQPLPVSVIDITPPDVPSDLSFSENLYLIGLSVVAVKGTVSWQTVGNAASYIVTYQREDQNAVVITGILENSIDIAPMTEGNYEISVNAVNTLGRQSQTSSISVTVYGKTLPPVDITGFSVNKIGGVAQGSWALHPDIDVQVGGQIVIRHSPMLTGASWQDGIILDSFSGNAINGLLPLITGTYMAKALDSSGNWSENMVSFVATEGMVTGFVTVATTVQAPLFTGIKTGTAAGAGVLQLASSETIGSRSGLISTWEKLSALGGVSSSGSYAFDAVMDLGTVATRRFEADITAQSFDTGDKISARGLVSQWGNVAGISINDCDATLYARVTDDDPSGSPVWSEPTPFFVADFTCRAAKFEIELASGISTHNIRISELSVAAKIPA